MYYYAFFMKLPFTKPTFYLFILNKINSIIFTKINALKNLKTKIYLGDLLVFKERAL